MSRKKPTKKGSSKSTKIEPKKEEKVDLSEYEDSFDGDSSAEEEKEVDLSEYELPEDFVAEEPEAIAEKDMNWFQKQIKKMQDLDNNQRLYWIKIMSGVVTGTILGLAGAQTGWWLFLMLGLYAGITAGGYFLFKLEWNFKEVIFSGFFPFLALFTLFWVLMFSSLYAPTIAEWMGLLEAVVTETINGTQVVYTNNRSTSPAGSPFIAIVLTVIGTLGLLQFMLRRNKRRESKSINKL